MPGQPYSGCAGWRRFGRSHRRCCYQGGGRTGVSPPKRMPSHHRFFSTPAPVPLHDRHGEVDDRLSLVESDRRRDLTAMTVTIRPDQIEHGTSRSTLKSPLCLVAQGRRNQGLRGRQRSGSVSADRCTGKGPDRTVRPLRGNEPVWIPMYAETSRRPPPSRPFLNLLCSLVCLPLCCLVRAFAGLSTDVVGTFCNTHNQRCQAASHCHSRAPHSPVTSVASVADP